MCFTGDGVEEDDNEAEEWFRDGRGGGSGSDEDRGDDGATRSPRSGRTGISWIVRSAPQGPRRKPRLPPPSRPRGRPTWRSGWGTSLRRRRKSLRGWRLWRRGRLGIRVRGGGEVSGLAIGSVGDLRDGKLPAAHPCCRSNARDPASAERSLIKPRQSPDADLQAPWRPQLGQRSHENMRLRPPRAIVSGQRRIPAPLEGDSRRHEDGCAPLWRKNHYAQSRQGVTSTSLRDEVSNNHHPRPTRRMEG